MIGDEEEVLLKKKTREYVTREQWEQRNNERQLEELKCAHTKEDVEIERMRLEWENELDQEREQSGDDSGESDEEWNSGSEDPIAKAHKAIKQRIGN